MSASVPPMSDQDYNEQDEPAGSTSLFELPATTVISSIQPNILYVTDDPNEPEGLSEINAEPDFDPMISSNQPNAQLPTDDPNEPEGLSEIHFEPETTVDPMIQPNILNVTDDPNEPEGLSEINFETDTTADTMIQPNILNVTDDPNEPEGLSEINAEPSTTFPNTNDYIFPSVDAHLPTDDPNEGPGLTAISFYDDPSIPPTTNGTDQESSFQLKKLPQLNTMPKSRVLTIETSKKPPVLDDSAIIIEMSADIGTVTSTKFPSSTETPKTHKGPLHGQHYDVNEARKIRISTHAPTRRPIQKDNSTPIIGTSTDLSGTKAPAISFATMEIPPTYIIYSGLLFALVLAIFTVYRFVKKSLRQRVLRKQFIELTEMDVNGLDRDSIKGLVRHYFPSKTYIQWKTLSMGVTCGKGNFGEVWKGCVLRSDGEPHIEVAIKCLNSENINLNALKEANLMKDLSGVKNILELYGVAVSDSCKICIITELMPNGSLHSYMNHHICSLNDKLRFCEEIASGLVYIHYKNVLHLDLAARNCMVDHRKRIRITDFGQSRKFTEYLQAVHLEDAAAAYRWMPIEFFDDQPITKAGDIWSFGVTAWEIFTECREDPYGNILLNHKYLKDGNRLGKPVGCDDTVFAMMSKCWLETKEQRPIAEELRTFFKPPTDGSIQNPVPTQTNTDTIVANTDLTNHNIDSTDKNPAAIVAINLDTN